MNCKSCGQPLGNLSIFCRPCYGLLPGNERASLYAMHMRRQDTSSKVAKCVRIIAAKRAKEKAKALKDPFEDAGRRAHEAQLKAVDDVIIEGAKGAQ